MYTAFFHARSNFGIIHKSGVFAFLLTLCTGCATLNTSQSARTLEAGAHELRLTGGLNGYNLERVGLNDEGQPIHKRVNNGYTLKADVGFRYGLNGNFDLGISAGTSGLAVDGKVQLMRGPVTAIALGVTASAGATPGDVNEEATQFVQAGIPLLIGFKLSEQVELVVAPRLSLSTYAMSATESNGAFATFLPSLSIAVLQARYGRSFDLIGLSFGYMTGIGLGGDTHSKLPQGLILNLEGGTYFGGPYSR